MWFIDFCVWTSNPTIPETSTFNYFLKSIWITAPLSSILLVVEADDEDTPVSLEEVSKDLENEGFKVDTIKGKDGEIKVIKVDIDVDDLALSESSEEKKEGNSDALTTLRKKREAGQKSFERIRRKRHLCLKCKLNDLHEKIHGHGQGGGYGGYGGCPTGNCGGGYGGKLTIIKTLIQNKFWEINIRYF